MAQHPLDLQPDDYILYQDEEIREEDRVTFVAQVEPERLDGTTSTSMARAPQVHPSSVNGRLKWR